MQLTKSRGELRCRLLASSCALLATAGAKADTGDLNYDFDLLYYAESGRVKATEPTIGVTRNLGSESSLSARIVVDSLTGATPTGEMPSSRGNSVTGASGSVSSAAGELPMAPFSDLRGAVSATWSKRMHVAPSRQQIGLQGLEDRAARIGVHAQWDDFDAHQG